MSTGDAALAHAAARLREADPDRFIASLFVPAPRRADVQALYAFDAEIAGIAARVSQPMAGEIRLQWWREAIAGERADEAAANPLAVAVLDVIARCRLPVAAFDNLLSARTRDLYDDPIATVGELEGYCGDTDAAVLRLACLAMAAGEGDPGGAAAAGHAGVALGTTRLLARAGRGRWAQLVPVEMLARHGARHADLVAAVPTPAIVATLSDLADLARRHLAAVRTAWGGLDPTIRPVFLPLALLEMRLRAAGRHPFAGRGPALWRRQAALWRAARRGRI
jgi:phytoene synthase